MGPVCADCAKSLGSPESHDQQSVSPRGVTPTRTQSEQSRRCLKCKHENASHAQFCAECGGLLQYETPPKCPRRPLSLSIVSVIMIVLCGGGYTAMMIYGLASTEGLTFTRIFVEPPESEGGIPWPGWEKIGEALRRELPPLSSENIGALYWSAKLKMAGGLVFGPLFIVGWFGVFWGRRWGRNFIYLYFVFWIADKAFYVPLLGPEGILTFGLAAGMWILLLVVIRSKSWSEWIEWRLGSERQAARS